MKFITAILKTIINLFLPKILSPTFIKNKINILIRPMNKIVYENNFYNRASFILRALNKFNLKKCTYLEIGVCDNTVFNIIPLDLKNKIGIDPVRGGTHRTTSDIFFKNNKKKFDIIFIDGLHAYKQCQKDCLNSLKFLNKNGFIFFHDFLPRNPYEENIPAKQREWSGDVWKVAVELNNSKNIDFVIANIDRGVGIIRPKKKYNYYKMEELTKLNFNHFIKKYYPKLPVVNCKNALEFIDK
jgi:hypothetical protein